MTTSTASTLPRSCLRVLLVVLQAADRGETLTNREIADRCGWRAGSTDASGKRIKGGNAHVAVCLHRLREEGLVTFENRNSRTLRPTCRLELWR